MNICIPTLDHNGLDSSVSSHFGKASLFAIVDDKANEIRFVQNSGQHHGGSMTPAEIIGKEDVNVILCGGLGVKAIRLFEQLGIHNLL